MKAFVLLLTTVTTLLLAGSCTSELPPGSGEPAGSQATPAPGGGTALATQLAAADALDGEVDHVVSKCAGCALGMDGKSENSLQLAGYTLHLCSPSCKERFEPEAEKKLLAMKVAPPN